MPANPGRSSRAPVLEVEGALAGWELCVWRRSDTVRGRRFVSEGNDRAVDVDSLGSVGRATRTRQQVRARVRKVEHDVFVDLAREHLDPRHVEQVAHQLCQAIGLLIDDRQEFLSSRFVTYELRLKQRPCVAFDEPKRAPRM